MNITLQGQTFELKYSDAFNRKLEELLLTYNAIMEQLREAEADVVRVADGESFFIIGSSVSIEGVKEGGVVTLSRLIPSSNVL